LYSFLFLDANIIVIHISWFSNVRVSTRKTAYSWSQVKLQFNWSMSNFLFPSVCTLYYIWVPDDSHPWLSIKLLNFGLGLLSSSPSHMGVSVLSFPNKTVALQKKLVNFCLSNECEVTSPYVLNLHFSALLIKLSPFYVFIDQSYFLFFDMPFRLHFPYWLSGNFFYSLDPNFCFSYMWYRYPLLV
jgi:hypothetical protein